MKKILSFGIQLSAIGLTFAFAVIFDSCSKLQNNNVLTPVRAQSDIHPSGWATKSSSNFHGTSIKTNNFNMTTCASCHGSDLAGGIAKISCYNCHRGVNGTSNNGTLACNTCHGSTLNPAPPKDLSGDSLSTFPTVGAHQNHVAGDEPFAQIACSSCHLVPQAAGPGLHPDGGKATVLFSGVALTETNTPSSQFYDSSLPTVIPSPVFNPQTLQCSNTYCHGNFKGGNKFSPKWTVLDGSQDYCGTCHGVPPHGAINGIIPFYQSASEQNCFLCHEPMMEHDGIQDSSLHVNGKLELYGRAQVSW